MARTFEEAKADLFDIGGLEEDSTVFVEEDFADGYFILRVPINWSNPTGNPLTEADLWYREPEEGESP